MEHINNIEGGIMIKVEVTEKFTLERFDKIKNLIRKGSPH